MDLVVSVKAGSGLVESIFGAVARFERVRVFGTLVILAVVGLGSLTLDTKIPSVVAAVAFVVIACLGLGWLRAIHRARASADAVGPEATVRLTDSSIEISSPGRNEALAWNQIMHGSVTEGGWLFVAKRSNAAFVIPRADLTNAQADELGRFLASWPKRRMRRVPTSRR